MQRARITALSALFLAAFPGATTAGSRYLPTRQINLECCPASGSEVTGIDLWVSSDACRSWQTAAAERVGRTGLRYTAPADGKYDFYAVLRNAAGASGDPPQAGSAPLATVIVDTVAPLLQIHSHHAEYLSDDRPTLFLRISLVEENQPKLPIRVFYRTTDRPWTDGGPAAFADGQLTWDPPESAGVEVDLRIVATDLAGNRTSADVLDITLPAATAAAITEEPPSAPSSQPADVADPPTVADMPPATQPAHPQRLEAADTQKLRTLAARFMGEGRYSLAAARLDDALAIAPADADLLVESGNALYRLARLDEARSRFEAALTASTDHTGALDGLALVAVTQRRYSDAREHLRHLLRLQPDAAVFWLRRGDIEHRLGNTSEALDAWRQALKVKDTTDEVRRNAQRRLDYFAPIRPAQP